MLLEQRELEEKTKRQANDIGAGYKAKKQKKEVSDVRKLPWENCLDSVTETSLNHYIQSMVFRVIKYVSFTQIHERHMAERIAAKLNIVSKTDLKKYKRFIEITIFKQIETCRNNSVRNMRIAFLRCARLKGTLAGSEKRTHVVLYVCFMSYYQFRYLYYNSKGHSAKNIRKSYARG